MNKKSNKRSIQSLFNTKVCELQHTICNECNNILEEVRNIPEGNVYDVVSLKGKLQGLSMAWDLLEEWKNQVLELSCALTEDNIDDVAKEEIAKYCKEMNINECSTNL